MVYIGTGILLWKVGCRDIVQARIKIDPLLSFHLKPNIAVFHPIQSQKVGHTHLPFHDSPGGSGTAAENAIPCQEIPHLGLPISTISHVSRLATIIKTQFYSSSAASSPPPSHKPHTMRPPS
jgi:hypothetical protein